MEVKVLITEGDGESLELMRKTIGAMGHRVVVAEDIDEMLDRAKREHPALIVIDIKCLTGSQKSLILESLQRSLVTREIPLLLTHTSPDIAWQEKYRMLGVRELVMKPLDIGAFQKTVGRLIHEGYGPMDFSERFARSFAAYNKSDTVAEQMIAKAMIAGRIHGYDEEELVRVRSALPILSVAILHQNLGEVLSLCANVMLSHEILQLIEDSRDPTDRSAALLYAVVQLTQRLEGGKPLYITPVTYPDSSIFSTVQELFESGLMRVRREEDIHLVWKEISERILEAREYSLKQVSDFLESALESVKAVLLKRQEAYLRLCDEHTAPKVEVFFTAEEGDNPCEDIATKTESVEIAYNRNNPENILERTGTGYARVMISLDGHPEPKAVPLSPPETVDLFDTIGTLTTASEATEISPLKADTISAAEFLATSQVDSEDIDTLEELEGEITRLVDNEAGSDSHFETIRAIVGFFRKYATTIMYISEFTAMVDGLLELSGTLEGIEEETLDGKRQQLVLALLERLADDLYQWRKAIFSDGECEDIHFMDDSIIASCRQVQSFLPKAVEADAANDAAVTLF